jgi:hypothetical protein
MDQPLLATTTVAIKNQQSAAEFGWSIFTVFVIPGGASATQLFTKEKLR